MSALHECPNCGYRFEDAESAEAHAPCPEAEPLSRTGEGSAD